MSTVRVWWWCTLVVSLTVSALVIAVPELRIGIESIRSRTAIETAQSLVGLLAGFLVFGRYKRTGRQADLVIAYALFLTASANLLVELFPTTDLSRDPQTFRTWARIATRMITGGALAWAALQPGLSVRWLARRAAFGLWMSVTWTLAMISAGAYLLISSLPTGEEVILVHGKLEPAVTGDAWLFGIQALVIALFAAASFGFLTQADRQPDQPLTVALAIGTLLGAVSWMIFLVYPTVFTDIVQPGDLIRLAFYVVLAVGAEREIHAYWQRLVRATASEERRRLARELHDGLAQELAFLSRQTRLFARGEAPEGTGEQLISAADRALDEARRAISTLTARDDEPLAVAIASAAEDVASRVGTHTRIEVAPDVTLPGKLREDVLRIVREAVGNAGRHGGASTVTVELGDDHVLRVTDDGAGFDPSIPPRSGRFGLTSMKERAEGLGGKFSVTSAPGRGTTVEVHLP